MVEITLPPQLKLVAIHQCPDDILEIRGRSLREFARHFGESGIEGTMFAERLQQALSKKLRYLRVNSSLVFKPSNYMRVSSGKPFVDAITKLVGKLLPVPEAERVTDEEWNNLRQRYATIDSVADYVCVAGIIVAATLPRVLRDGMYQAWDVGVLFGLAVVFPFLWLCMCILLNFANMDELFRYTSAKHGINMRRIFSFFYLPIIVIGVVCAIFAYR